MDLEYFIKVKKYNDFKTNTVETKYIAALLEKSFVSNETLCKQVETNCTLSRHEMGLALDELSDVVKAALLKGCKVQLGNLGTLRLKFDAKAQNSPEDVTRKTITRVKCVFQPSKDLVNAINNASIQKVDFLPQELE